MPKLSIMRDIKVYSTEACPYCVALKNFLKEKGVDFKEIDVSQNQEAAKEMVEKTNQRGVPVLEVDGQFIVGFNRKKIEELL